MTQNDQDLDQEISFSFAYTPELAVSALQQHYYNHRKNYLPFLFAVASALFGLAISRGDIAITGAGFFLGFFAIYFLEFMILKILYPWIAKRQFAKTPVYSQNMHFTIRQNGLHVKTDKSENTILWTDVIKWERSPNFDMLYTGPQLYYILPSEIVDLDRVYNLYEAACSNNENANPENTLDTINAPVKYQLSAADVIAASQLHLRKPRLQTFIFHMVLSSIPAIITIGSRGFNIGVAAFVGLCVFILLKLIDALFDKIILPQFAARKFKKSPYLHHGFGIEFEPGASEIHIHSFTGKTRMSGNEIIKVKKSQTHYLLYIGPRLYIILPIAQLKKQNFDFSAFDATLEQMNIKIEAL